MYRTYIFNDMGYIPFFSLSTLSYDTSITLSEKSGTISVYTNMILYILKVVEKRRGPIVVILK